MPKILREPLLHFLLIGAALFIVFGLVNDMTFGDADTRPIVEHEWAWRVPTYAIGGIAAYWMIERVAGF